MGLLAGATTNQTLHYVEPDHLGTPRVVIDPTRDVAVWTLDTKGEAFGSTVPNQNPDGDANAFVFNMRFPGQRFDQASGLNQNGFRDYDSATGRYPQSDPIGLNGGLNTYAYVGGQPLAATDELGLQSAAAGQAVTTLPPIYTPPGQGNWDAGMEPGAPTGGPRINLPSAPDILIIAHSMSPQGLFWNTTVKPVLNCIEENDRERNCQALRQSILKTCASLKGRKMFACFAAAQESYRQCMED